MSIKSELTVNGAITEVESNSFFIIKAIAIMSIITAHILVPINDEGIFIKAVTNFWAAFARTGVVAFFVLSGFFYHREKGDTLSFWSKKLKFLIFPWLFFSSLIYIYIFIRGNPVSALGYIKYILGHGSSYYYITVLIVFYVIFKFFCSNNYMLWLCMVLNITAIIVRSLNLTPKTSFITDYLNIFHWIGFFALGVYIRKYRLDRKLLNSVLPFGVCTFIFIIDCAIIQKIEIYTYFHIFSLQYELIFLVIMLYLGRYLLNLGWLSRFLTFCGKNTLFIYLVHMPIVQAIVYRLPDCIAKYIFSPFFSLAIMVSITFGIKKVAEKMPPCDKLLKYFAIK